MGRKIVKYDDMVKSKTEVQKQPKIEEERKEIGLRTKSSERKYYDHPSTMENGTATLLYIITMVVGAIFNDRLLIWITATAIYFKFITRHNKKK